MKKEYIKTGKCIWCGRTKADGATFFKIPHILPRALGGIETCCDVCDECNQYFGSDRVKYGISQDEAVKGILQVAQRYLSLTPPREKTPIFNFYVNQHKITIKRSQIHLTQQGLTRQFKRGMCECFLQKYHFMTNDGNNPIFDKLRKYARYDDGDISFYCVVNKILIATLDERKPVLRMSEKDIVNIRRYGLFVCAIFGHIIIMDVNPNAPHYEKMIFCKDLSNLYIFVGYNLYIDKLDSIDKLDILYTRFNNFQSPAISKDSANMPFIQKPE